MRKNAAFILLTALFLGGCEKREPTTAPWQSLMLEVKEEKLNRAGAKDELSAAVAELRAYSARFKFEEGPWAYPLARYSWTTMYKGDFKPNAFYGPYKTRGYNFFDGNKHGGHPAHDIFIPDGNRNSLDDKTGKPVNVVSMTDAVVLSAWYEWHPGSASRGGKYAWTYSPVEGKFFYYAHMNLVLVAPGQFLKKGQLIGTVGRTGLLAARKTSPTHLHLMVLEYKDGNMIPYDYYKRLK
jgi:peptidoglycan LD-endopeptidase LytH